MKPILAALVLACAALPAAAELVTKRSALGVAETMDKLEAAVAAAGATVFARVDHAGGAATVDMELAPAQLLIFGNPKLGTPAMQDDPRAGVFLPLRVLAYTGADGVTVVTYELPAEMLEGLDIPADAPVVAMMTGALDKLTDAAIGD